MRPLFALAALAALTVACGGGNTPTSPSLPFTATTLTRGLTPAPRTVTNGTFDVSP
jgi:hypothetical protein